MASRKSYLDRFGHSQWRDSEKNVGNHLRLLLSRNTGKDHLVLTARVKGTVSVLEGLMQPNEVRDVNHVRICWEARDCMTSSEWLEPDPECMALDMSVQDARQKFVYSDRASPADVLAIPISERYLQFK